MPKDAPLRTDRGHVVLTELPDQKLLVEICERISITGSAVNVFAEHVGVSSVVIEPSVVLSSIGASMSSTREVVVFNDASDGKLHIAAMRDRGGIGK